MKRKIRLESIRNNYVSLIGDSIIDNKVYVGEEELSVTEHLKHKSSSNFTMIAVDGDTTHDIFKSQLDNLKEPVTHIGGEKLAQAIIDWMKN